MKDEAVTRFAVTTALRGVEEKMALARGDVEREDLALRHRELRAMLPPEPAPPIAATGSAPEAAEERKYTPLEYLQEKIRRLLGELRGARTEDERERLSKDLIDTESVLAGCHSKPAGKPD